MKIPSMPAMPAMPAAPSMGDLSSRSPVKIKTGLHSIQGILIFIAWIVTIALLVAPGPTGGGPNFFFALCWFSVPVLIYLAAVPLWPKTKRFANPLAFVALDGLFTIFWFAAFVAVLAWNSSGQKAGAAKKKLPTANCTTYDYGSEERCKLAKAMGGIGGFIFMFFVFTTALSVHGLMYFRKNGTLPGDSAPSDPSSIEAQTRDAFSTADQQDNSREGGARHDDDDEYALLHSNENNGARHTGRPLSWGDEGQHGAEEFDTPYHGGYADHHERDHGDSGRVSPYEPDYPEGQHSTHEADFDSPYGGGGHGYSGGHGAAPPYSR